MSNKLRLIDHLDVIPIESDLYVMWNRFFPVLLKLNKAGFDFVTSFTNNNTVEITDQNKSIIDMLLKYRILYNGDSDPSKKNFTQSIENIFGAVKKNADDFYKNESPYNKLDIMTDECNLGCSYCVNYYKHIPSSKKVNAEQKLKVLNHVVDQFFSRKIQKGKKETIIAFNGGEFLLEWDIMKPVVQRISDEYKQVNVEYALNTNMTLMTEEIAEFLAHHNFKIFFSIDGYRYPHERTRVYKNGNGTYDRIIENLKIYRKYNKNYHIVGFQGTIEYIEGFDPREVYKMQELGFIEARLAPNLLDVSEENAVEKARLMGIFLDLNMENSFKVREVYFDNMTKLINNDSYQFFFNCKGLSAYPEIQLSFNLSTQTVSHLCAYIPLASIPLNELGNDIYNPSLWKRSSEFIWDRLNSIFENCMECEMVTICRGGCIYTGLDKENKINKAACAYQKEMWRIYVEKVYKVGKEEN